MNDKLTNEHFETFEDISEGGERVSHLFQNDVYFAHLSIYHFALQYCYGKTVLDAGSGAGYGSAYLLDHGAQSVDAIDIEEKAVKFSRYHFSKPNLTYQVMSMEEIKGFPPHSFDVIFTSNALEHVPNVFPFFRSAWELLKPEGILIIAVPPIMNDLQLQANLDNPYHLNIWSPRQWFHALTLYFSELQPYLHRFDKPGVELNFANAPDQTHVDEADFIFEPISLDDFYQVNTLTAIFVAQKPRNESELPFPDSQLRFVDDSFTRPPATAEQPIGVGTSSLDSSLRKMKSGELSFSAYFVEIKRLISRAWETLRQEGWRSLARRIKFYFIAGYHK